MALTKISGEVIQQPINIGVITATSVTATSATFSDNVSIGAGATTAFFEVDTGNVGIGTDNPFYKFEVRGDTNTEIRIGNFDDSEAGILLSNVGSTNRRIVAAGGDMIFRGGASTSDEHVRIDSSGNVGIGTDNPSMSLHVYHPTENSVAFFESGDAFGSINLADSNGSVTLLTTLGHLRINTGGDGATPGTNASSAMMIQSDGDVGIGTDNPQAKLHVSGGNIKVDDGFGIDFSATTDATGMDNELLDDYEEGTWTPSYDTSTTSSTAIAYSNQTGGSYIKVGRAVYICGRIRTNTSQSLDGTGAIILEGLPFAISSGFDGSADTQDCSAVFSVQQVDGWTDGPTVMLGQEGNAFIYLYNGATFSTTVNVADFNTGGTGINRMRFSGFYFTDS